MFQNNGKEPAREPARENNGRGAVSKMADKENARAKYAFTDAEKARESLKKIEAGPESLFEKKKIATRLHNFVKATLRNTVKPEKVQNLNAAREVFSAWLIEKTENVLRENTPTRANETGAPVAGPSATRTPLAPVQPNLQQPPALQKTINQRPVLKDRHKGCHSKPAPGAKKNI